MKLFLPPDMNFIRFFFIFCVFITDLLRGVVMLSYNGCVGLEPFILAINL